MPLKTGDMLLTRYRIVRLVGQGGFGAVYRAWDVNVSQPVALKENLGTDREAQRQFEREANLLAGLRHPNLPRVTDHFIVPGQGQYLVMDYIEGHSLAALLRQRGGPLPEGDALHWARQVCDALSYLHGRTPPIIHRDIKPENVIVTADGRAMLVDFGISKVFQADGHTTVGAMAVTPGFSPPEQYGGMGTDARSDVYALAATLYKLLTGQTPPDSIDVMAAGVRVPEAHALNPALRPQTAWAIEQAMAPQMSQRTPSAAAFAAALSAPAQPERAAPPVATVVASPAAVDRAAMPATPQPPVVAAVPATAAPARAGGGLASLALLLFGVALNVALFWLARELERNYYDDRLVPAAYGAAAASILLICAWGGPWLGALGGALVGVALHYLFYWEWPFVIPPVAVGFISGVLTRGGRLRSFFGAVWLGLLAALTTEALRFGVIFYLWDDTSFDAFFTLYFVAGATLASLAIWLLTKVMPRSLLRLLPPRGWLS